MIIQAAAILSAMIGLGVASAAPTSAQPLPTGQKLTPLAAPGATFTALTTRVGPKPAYVADGAAAVAVSPDGREMLVLTSGFNRFNGADGKVLPGQSTQYVLRYAIGPTGAHRLQTLQVANSYSGVAWAPDGRSFAVGGGVDDDLHLFRRTPGGSFRRNRRSHRPGPRRRELGADVKPQAAGVAFSPDGARAAGGQLLQRLRQPGGRAPPRRDRPSRTCGRARSIPAQVRAVPGGEFPLRHRLGIDAGRAYRLRAPRPPDRDAEPDAGRRR